MEDARENTITTEQKTVTAILDFICTILDCLMHGWCESVVWVSDSLREDQGLEINFILNYIFKTSEGLM